MQLLSECVNMCLLNRRSLPMLTVRLGCISPQAKGQYLVRLHQVVVKRVRTAATSLRSDFAIQLGCA